MGERKPKKPESSTQFLFVSRGVFCLTACDQRAIKPPSHGVHGWDYARRYNLQHTSRYLAIDGQGVCYHDSGHVTLVKPRIAAMMSLGLTSCFTQRTGDNERSRTFGIVAVVPKDIVIELLW